MSRRARAAAFVAGLHTIAIVIAGITVWLATRPHLPVLPTPAGAMPTAGLAGIGAALVVGLGLDPVVGKAITALGRTSREA